MTKENSRRGKSNRQSGYELQREITRMAKNHNLNAHNRDRGGAQHEMGDLEIEKQYYGCKRRKKMAQWLKPEKQEVGVFLREDYGKSFIVLDAENYISLLRRLKSCNCKINRCGCRDDD